MLGIGLGVQFSGGAATDSILDQLISELGASSYLWVDDGSGELVDTQTVGTWTDLIQSVTLTQSTESNKPVGSAQGSGFIAVDFDGVDDNLSLSSFSPTNSQANIIYALIKTDSATGNEKLCDSPSGGRHMIEKQNGKFHLYAGASANATTTHSTNPVLISIEYNGSSSNAWQDGVSILSGGNTGTNSQDSLILGSGIGGANAFAGLVYAFAIEVSGDTSKRSQIESLMNEVCGSPVTLP